MYKKRLKQLQDVKYKEFSEKLIFTKYEILGIRTKYLEELAKEILTLDYISFLELEKVYYEEILLEGFIIAKSDDEIRRKYLDKFILKIDNWAICDMFCNRFKIKKKTREYYYNYFKNYLKSDKDFVVRTGLIMFLSHFINDDYIDRILFDISVVTNNSYYVEMALAWLLSVCYIKYKDKTKEYLEYSNLDDFTYNKTIQKLLDSKRVSKEEKEVLRTMKRKKI